MNAVTIYPIIVAAISTFIISSLWYSQLLFGRHWAKLVGLDDQTLDETRMSAVWKSYAAQLIASIVLFSVLGFIFVTTGMRGAVNGATLGALAWLGFIATDTVGKILWEKLPIKLACINAGISLFNLALGGAIIGSWGN